MARRAQPQHLLDVGEHNARPAHEIPESGVARTRETPDQAEQQQAGDGVAGPDVDDF
jgi:hypothetical protein